MRSSVFSRKVQTTMVNDRTPVPSYAEDRATEKQVSFMRDLFDRKNLFADPQWFDSVNAMDKDEYAAHLARIKEQLPSVSKMRARDIISKLLALPDAPREEQQRERQRELIPDVPAGRYAIERDGVLKFFRVDRPQEPSRWAGYTFLKSLRGGPHGAPAEGNIRAPEYKLEVLEQIAQDPKGAAERYGQELGECGICGRTLTDETSRKIGIGPVCRSRSDWY